MNELWRKSDEFPCYLLLLYSTYQMFYRRTNLQARKILESPAFRHILFQRLLYAKNLEE
jgi:hypothetical protein